VESSTGLRVIEVSGTFESMGGELGERCRDLAKVLMTALRSRLKLRGIDMDKGRSMSSKFLPYAEEYDPDYIAFLRSYAEAADLRFEDLFVHFCLDEKGFCTDIAVNGDVTSDGSVLSAHTEDWATDYAGHVVLIKGRPKGGPRFLALSLCGAEIDCGMNDEGISFTGNSLYPDDERVGIPKMFNARRILASRTMGEALAVAFPEKRASSYNHNICHKSGEMFSVEGSATDFSVISADAGWLVHTNHYLSDEMRRHDTVFTSPSGRSPGTAPSTVLRYHRACRLLRPRLGEVSTDVLKSIMEDHFNHPRSICCHFDERAGPEDRYATIFSVVFDLTKLEAHVCPTNPCVGSYEVHSVHSGA
jgi:isopenicillin-N N-acyltransferase-like protein